MHEHIASRKAMNIVHVEVSNILYCYKLRANSLKNCTCITLYIQLTCLYTYCTVLLCCNLMTLCWAFANDEWNLCVNWTIYRKQFMKTVWWNWSKLCGAHSSMCIQQQYHKKCRLVQIKLCVNFMSIYQVRNTFIN